MDLDRCPHCREQLSIMVERDRFKKIKGFRSVCCNKPIKCSRILNYHGLQLPKF